MRFDFYPVVVKFPDGSKNDTWTLDGLWTHIDSEFYNLLLCSSRMSYFFLDLFIY